MTGSLFEALPVLVETRLAMISTAPATAAPPDDPGFSLEELGRALAGEEDARTTPYREAEEDRPDRQQELPPTGEGDEHTAAVAEPPLPTAAQVEQLVATEPFDERCDLSPRSILEAMLFTGHPSNEPLTSEQVAALKETLKASVGKDVTLQSRVDPSLLGGLIVKLGSRMIDSSLKTKLQNIKLALTEAST